MGFLKLLEGIRFPFLDSVFSLITHLGEETIFIVLGLVFFWCINKKQGYFLLSVGFLGTVINQFLKLSFRIPRPWVRDPEFTIVESARAEATGYSFPSGHTQSSVGVFGSIARITTNKILRILCFAACILVPLSRLYLGVHTPADVIVSILVATALIFILYPVVNKVTDKPAYMRLFLLVLTILAGLFLLYVETWAFPVDIDPHNLESGMKNAYKILGCILGLWVAYEIDVRYIHFDTKAIWWAQILKLVLGLLPLLIIKSLLKTPLYNLFNGLYVADGVRYFLIVLFAGCIWPATFKFWSRLK
jgi:undecaprenyl-diphosphatase